MAFLVTALTELAAAAAYKEGQEQSAWIWITCSRTQSMWGRFERTFVRFPQPQIDLWPACFLVHALLFLVDNGPSWCAWVVSVYSDEAVVDFVLHCPRHTHWDFELTARALFASSIP